MASEGGVAGRGRDLPLGTSYARFEEPFRQSCLDAARCGVVTAARISNRPRELGFTTVHGWVGDCEQGVIVMRRRADWVVLVLLVLAFSVGVIPVANAYMDPGAGSYIFQVIVGVLLGAGVAVKVFWHRILNLFRKDRSSDEE